MEYFTVPLRIVLRRVGKEVGREGEEKKKKEKRKSLCLLRNIPQKLPELENLERWWYKHYAKSCSP